MTRGGGSSFVFILQKGILHLLLSPVPSRAGDLFKLDSVLFLLFFLLSYLCSLCVSVCVCEWGWAGVRVEMGCILNYLPYSENQQPLPSLLLSLSLPPSLSLQILSILIYTTTTSQICFLSWDDSSFWKRPVPNFKFLKVLKSALKAK